MSVETLEKSLKKMSLHNKKLLESISTHLINHPDELQDKIQENRILSKSYADLCAFSQDNIEKIEKHNSEIMDRDKMIDELKRKIQDMKEDENGRVSAVEKEMRKKRIQDSEEVDKYKYQVRSVKKQLAELKEKFEGERKSLVAQNYEKQQKISLLSQKLKQMEGSSNEKMRLKQKEVEDKDQQIKQMKRLRQKEMQDKEEEIRELKKKIKQCQSEVEKAKKHGQISSLDEIKSSINNFRNRQNL